MRARHARKGKMTVPAIFLHASMSHKEKKDDDAIYLKGKMTILSACVLARHKTKGRWRCQLSSYTRIRNALKER